MWLGASAYHGHAPACGLDQSSLPGSFNPSLISAISTRQNSDWQNPGAENRQIKESPERESVVQYLECHFVIVTTDGLEIWMSSNGKIGTLVVFDNMSTYNLLSSKVDLIKADLWRFTVLQWTIWTITPKYLPGQSWELILWFLSTIAHISRNF